MNILEQLHPAKPAFSDQAECERGEKGVNAKAHRKEGGGRNGGEGADSGWRVKPLDVDGTAEKTVTLEVRRSLGGQPTKRVPPEKRRVERNYDKALSTKKRGLYPSTHPQIRLPGDNGKLGRGETERQGGLERTGRNGIAEKSYRGPKNLKTG